MNEKYNVVAGKLVGIGDVEDLIDKIWSAETKFFKSNTAFYREFIILDKDVPSSVRRNYQYTDTEHYMCDYVANTAPLRDYKVLRLRGAIRPMHHTVYFDEPPTKATSVPTALPDTYRCHAWSVIAPRYIEKVVAPSFGVYQHLKMLGRHMYSARNGTERLRRDKMVKVSDSTFGILYISAGVDLHYQYRDANKQLQTDYMRVSALILTPDGLLLTNDARNNCSFLMMSLEEVYNDEMVHDPVEAYFEEHDRDVQYASRDYLYEDTDEDYGSKPRWNRYRESYDDGNHSY